MNDAYSTLEERFEKSAHIEHAIQYLEWDQLVGMPTGGAAARAKSMATLKRILHDLIAAPELGDLIAKATDGALDDWQSANVTGMKRRWLRERAVPADLVAAHSRAASRSEEAWRKAYSRNDWGLVREDLEEVVSLTREKASAIGSALGCDPYDALLDEHEPGLTRAEIDSLFMPLREALPPLIDRAIARQPAFVAPQGPFPIEKQKALGEALIRAFDFDLERGRFDTSMHPFTTGERNDTRITTRYSTDDFHSAHYATIHEIGHGKYQQNLPAAYAEKGQPVGEYAGVAMHEGMSLIVEKRVGRSDAYLEYLTPILQRTFAGDDGDPSEWQTPNISAMVRHVDRTYIRVEADEVTYPLHIILRYELETALIDGSLAVADLPEAWDAKMQEYFGLSTEDDDRLGCLQDIHNYLALFAYFPTYTVGAVIAAQLYDAALKSISDLEDSIRKGDFAPFFGWLGEHIYSRGRSKPTMALIVDATGAALSPQPLLQHLEARYAS